MKWNDILRNLREDADLTQNELAKKLNLTQRIISSMEIGRTEPNLTVLKSYCTYFKISADIILGIEKFQ